MKTLLITKNRVLNNFEWLNTIWEASPTIGLSLSIAPEECTIVVHELVKRLPADIAFSILSELAEDENLEESLVRLIFEKGDKGCKMAIAMRKNLPEDIVEQFRHATDSDIKEHFMLKQK